MNEAANSTVALPELAEGETYVGAIGDRDGKLHHVILLPGDRGEVNWEDAKEWAESIGGSLPNRIEQAMLWANCRNEFKKDWYWSCEEESSGWAWYQHFCYGGQDYLGRSLQLRARAVRRLSI